jgi:hypothetical protein
MLVPQARREANETLLPKVSSGLSEEYQPLNVTGKDAFFKRL